MKDYFLYVGSVIERKGLLQCVLAYAKLHEKYRKPFVVIGNGDKDYMRKVKEMIQYYRLESNFLFVNGVTNAELVAYYDHCFCLVYPSIFEGFGIPIIESLFRHKPVITSDISSLPDKSIKFFYGEGYEGLPSFAPFDRVIITAAAPEIPQKLIEQLKPASPAGEPGGMMVIPLGSGDVQQMMRITKLESGALKEEVFDHFSFVPMHGGRNS